MASENKVWIDANTNIIPITASEYMVTNNNVAKLIEFLNTNNINDLHCSYLNDNNVDILLEIMTKCDDLYYHSCSIFI